MQGELVTSASSSSLSPCIGVCRITEGTCDGCLRTLHQIAHWRRMNVSERMAIMKELERKKRDSPPCPECGVPNKCAIELGKSSNLCWCMHVQVGYSQANNYDTCLCKECLEGGSVD